MIPTTTPVVLPAGDEKPPETHETWLATDDLPTADGSERALGKRKTEPGLAAGSAHRERHDRSEAVESARSDSAVALDRNDVASDVGRTERVAERTEENPGGTENRV